MSEPRFVVTALTGYKIPTTATVGTSRHLVTDYYVQDRLYLYAVVAAFVPDAGGHPRAAWRKHLADAECNRLNAWWQDELAVG